MSKLQQMAKPILLPMIQGKANRLDRKQQKIISAWATITAMTSEFVNDEFSAIPQTDRDSLRDNLRVPKGWRIWIGRYRWAEGVERWTHHVMTLAEQGYEGPAGELGHPMNTQTTTICVGQDFMVHIMSSSVDTGQSILRRWNFPDPINACLRQVHPAAASVVRWPPPRIIAPKELYYIANTFFDRCERLLLTQATNRIDL